MSNRKPKVAMLADFPYREDDLFRGGVMQANYWLVKALAKQEGLDLFVLTPTRAAKREETRDEGRASIHFFSPQNEGYDTLLLYSDLRRRFNSLLFEIQPDLVHAQATPSYILTALCGKWPSIVTIHGIYRNELRVIKSRTSPRERLAHWIVSRIEAYNFTKICNLIAITSEIESTVQRHAPEARIFRVNNPIDEHFFTIETTPAQPVVLFVGWISYRKGVHLLLDAFEKLCTSSPTAQLRLIGSEEMDPGYGAFLRTRHARLVREGRVFFLGRISQERLYKELSQACVICLPSLAESAPMVIAQSMAAAKPVVATTVGGVADMVKDGVTGRLCPPNDSLRLAECLGELLQNPLRCLEMGVNARGIARQRYHPDSVAKATIAAYLEVIESNGRGQSGSQIHG